MSEMNTRKCSVEDCTNFARSKGYCAKHYARVKFYGRENVVRAVYGEGTIRSDGYKQLSIDGRLVLEHTYLAEKALGKPLPFKAEIHHMNEDKSDNHTPFNLIICPDRAYHLLLHKRTRDICGEGGFKFDSDENVEPKSNFNIDELDL